jgi:uncharacterized delta-60 repeat protein
VAVLLSVSTPAHAVWLDRTFGYRGVATDYIAVGSVAGIAALPDGRILVAATGNQGEAVVRRFDRSGGRDESFGSDGSATLEDPSRSFFVSSMVLQPDGRIVIAGGESSAAGQGFFAARFLPDGTLDTTFGGAGFVTTDFAAGFATALALAIQDDGKIVLAGAFDPPVPPNEFPLEDFAAARYDPDGSLDSSFGTAGRLVLDLGGRLPERARAIVIEMDGRIVLGGTTDQGNGFVLVGLLPDGSVDPGFGAAGRFLLPYGTGADCNAMTLQRDGKIVAAGWVFPPNAELVVRLFPNGSLDPSFGQGGIATVPAPAVAAAVALDAAGRIVLAGNPDFVLTRLLPNGRPDTSVGSEGWLSAHLDGGAQHHADAHAVAIQADGKILLGGDRSDFGSYVLMIRYQEQASSIPTLASGPLLILFALLALTGWIRLARS